MLDVFALEVGDLTEGIAALGNLLANLDNELSQLLEGLLELG